MSKKNTDSFARYDTCETNVAQRKEDIKTAKSNLAESVKDRRAEMGKLIDELCTAKSWDFKQLCRSLQEIDLNMDEIMRGLEVLKNRSKTSRVMQAERTDTNE